MVEMSVCRYKEIISLKITLVQCNEHLYKDSIDHFDTLRIENTLEYEMAEVIVVQKKG